MNSTKEHISDNTGSSEEFPFHLAQFPDLNQYVAIQILPPGQHRIAFKVAMLV